MSETREQPPKPMSGHMQNMLKLFDGRTLVGDYKSLAMKIHDMAKEIVEELDSQNDAVVYQLQMGCQHLLEAQDCFVRAKAVTPG